MHLVVGHGRGPSGPRAAERRRAPAVAEVVGYLGTSLALAGVAILVAPGLGRGLGVAARVGVTAAVAAVLVVAGRLVREDADPATDRLRWFLWLAAAGAAGGTGGVIAADIAGAGAATAVLVAASTATVVSVALWRRRARPVQQAATLVGVVAVVGLTVSLGAATSVAGLAVVLTGALLVALGLRSAIPVASVTVGVGAAAVVVGAVVTDTAGDLRGMPVLLVGAAGLLALAEAPATRGGSSVRLALLGFGAFAAVHAVPATIGFHAVGSPGATGLVVWGVGVALVGLGLGGWPRTPTVVALAGAAALLVGAAIAGAAWGLLAPLLGLASSAVLVGLGLRREQPVVCLAGALGLAVFVPWVTGRYLPAEGRVALAVLVPGVVCVAVAVLVARTGSRRRPGVADGVRAPRS